MRQFIGGLVVALALTAGSGSSLAEDVGAPAYRFETYASVDYDGRAASLTTSTVWSIFGPLNDSGFRLKLDGLADVYGDTNASVFSNSFLATDLKGLGAITAGYLFQAGSFWWKVYAGAAYESHIRAFLSVGQLTTQQNWGGAAALEAYWRIDSQLQTSVSLSWLQPDKSGALYEKVVYDFFSAGAWTVGAGAEAGIQLGGTETFKEGTSLGGYEAYARAGVLLEIRYGPNDLSVSGGVSRETDDVLRPYAAIRYGRKF